MIRRKRKIPFGIDVAAVEHSGPASAESVRGCERNMTRAQLPLRMGANLFDRQIQERGDE